MKSPIAVAAVSLAATTAAYIIPTHDSQIEQIPVDHKKVQDSAQAWWTEISNTPSTWDDTLSSFIKGIADNIELALTSAVDSVTDLDVDSEDDDELLHDGDHGDHGGHHGHHGDCTKSIYELIKESKYTQRFSELVDEYDDIKKLLNDTDNTNQNYTLFVPSDRAFDRIPDHGKKPSKEFVEAVLKYHIVPDHHFVAKRLLGHSEYTLPTELKSDGLGDDKQQRLRVVTLPLGGARLNFYAKVVAANIIAKNGVVHGLDAILLPPPPIAKVIKLLPNTFSTFSLGMETTGLGQELDDSPDEVKGGTLFAPTNHAFARLGRRANAFLFSEYGKKYLKAILKYHIVANETLYSDAYYKNDNIEDENADYRHVDLPSLLDEKPISVDIRHFKGFTSMVVNGFTRVSVKDGVAYDGVIQVVDKVLIPPHKHQDGDHEGGSLDEDYAVPIDIDALRVRLEPYLDADDSEDERNLDL